MMWASSGGYSGTGIWWGPVGGVACLVFMAVCMVMMGRMMGSHHAHDSHMWHMSPRHWQDTPERRLADRLARGDIDIEEYNRRLAILKANGDIP